MGRLLHIRFVTKNIFKISESAKRYHTGGTPIPA